MRLELEPKGRLGEEHNKAIDTRVDWHVKAWYGNVDKNGYLNGLGVYWEPDGGCSALPLDYRFPEEVKEETTTQDVITMTTTTTTSSTRVKERDLEQFLIYGKV